MRKGKAKRRILLPDSKYGEVLVTQFVNNLMQEGKKQLAFTLFYKALDNITARGEGKGIDIWRQALSNATPSIEVRSRRIGGATFQVPVEVREARRLSLAMKWLVHYASKRNEHAMSEKLASEMIAASKGEGNTIKKKEDTHRMAEANKAFSHYRFH